MFNKNTTPFTLSHLEAFERELNEAGGFNELMFRKRAFIRKNGSLFIVIYENVNEYKEKYLTGEYISLRSAYKTKVPYSFWSKMHIELRKSKGMTNPL